VQTTAGFPVQTLSMPREELNPLSRTERLPGLGPAQQNGRAVSLRLAGGFGQAFKALVALPATMETKTDCQHRRHIGMETIWKRSKGVRRNNLCCGKAIIHPSLLFQTLSVVLLSPTTKVQLPNRQGDNTENDPKGLDEEMLHWCL